ncbi:hypothetical protein FisN_17Lh059 [Fistulifera solaris]|uniref:Uncharacterized protein n=1 Tax=Fistulifera solaris TaxID=1519565 RepID=A0A1Z5K1I3_FISSO|nr:hypothetical protein FisN_17Lh059 [Fistulifera solaris]|eukprot:GAX20107.1 hypothetical protein FisN_17Lh059 [Fistulifera solaris]
MAPIRIKSIAIALALALSWPSLSRAFVCPSRRAAIPSVTLWEKETTTTDNEVRAEAQDALNNVGWSMPAEGDLTSDDPFVQAIDAGIQRDVGVPLDALLNPAKVVNLERDLYNLRMELATLTGRADIIVVGDDKTLLTTTECDGGGGGDDAEALRQKIAKKEKDLIIERRSVFRGWLKNIFLAQAILSFGLSYVMATNPASLFGGYGWYGVYNMDVSIQVLGYWWWWLFVIPSLRSRRPKGAEKKALDIAFLASPAISLLAPVATKDTGLIWTANFVVVASAYAFAYLVDSDDSDDDSNTPEWLKFVYKSLDFGSGRERGARQ